MRGFSHVEIRTWRYSANGLVAFDQVGRVVDYGAAGAVGRVGTLDADVCDGRGRVYHRSAVGGVKHDHGGTGSDDAQTTTDAAAGGTHGPGAAVATGIAAGALGILAAAMRRVMVLLVMADTHGPGRSAVPHLVDVLVVVFAGGRAGVAAPVRRRRAQVLVRAGARAAVAAVHLHFNCGHGNG